MEDRCAAHCERSWKFFVAVLKCEINVVLDNRSHPRDARLVEAKVCRASDMNWLLFEVVVAAPVAENVVRGSSVSHLFAAGNAVGRNSVGVIAVGSAPAAAGASNDIDGRGYTQILKVDDERSAWLLCSHFFCSHSASRRICSHGLEGKQL